MMNDQELRDKITNVLKLQGFVVGSQVKPREDSKEAYRKLHWISRMEKIRANRNFLLEHFKLVREYCRNGNEITPEEISLELKEANTKSKEYIFLKWWNLIWWSLPYNFSYGRQMRFLIWDKKHDAPFGIIVLQSPILKMKSIMEYLQIPSGTLDIWMNMSLYAQRIGAIPPYNELLGGKMVALGMTCNEVRKRYREKYNNRLTLSRQRNIPPNLLFITTTSAYGKSSIYDRLRYYNEPVAIKIGYTRGSGTFHIPDALYAEMLNYLKEKGVDTRRGFGHGPSRKLKLISLCLKYLGIPTYEYHNVTREIYLFPLVRNLEGVIHKNETPIWIDRPFCDLEKYWKIRWCIPRSKRTTEWMNFARDKFLNEVLFMLK